MSNFVASIGVAGYYKVEIIDRITGIKKIVMDYKKNKITDLGLNDMCEGVYGRGTMFLMPIVLSSGEIGQSRAEVIRTPSFPEYAPPTLYPPYPNPPNFSSNPSAIKPGTIVSSTKITLDDSGNTSDGTYTYGWSKRIFRFDTTDSYVVASMGVGGTSRVSWTSSIYGPGHPNGGYDSIGFFSNTNLFDINGDPLIISKGPNDIIDVTFEIRCYAQNDDTFGSFEYEGVTYYTTLRPAYKDSSQDWRLTSSSINFRYCRVSPNPINDATSGISGTSGSISSVTLPYERWSHERFGYIDFGLDIGNFAGNKINSFEFETSYSIGMFQVQFTPGLPKTKKDYLRFTFGVSWYRYGDS